MSLGIVIKGPEGIVLAAESRVTLGSKLPNGQDQFVNFDNATKLLSFSQPNTSVGAVTYGQAAIGLRTAHSYIPEFEAALPEGRLAVDDFAKKLSDFYTERWAEVMDKNYEGPDMTFVVGGFNEGEPYGHVYMFEIPKSPEPKEQHAGKGAFGITWGGQREMVDRLIQGYDHRLPAILKKTLGLDDKQVADLQKEIAGLQMPIPLAAMPLQDCVDLGIFFIRTTIAAQQLTVTLRGCGGPIDVATITRREGLQFVQRKRVMGERGISPQSTEETTP